MKQILQNKCIKYIHFIWAFAIICLVNVSCKKDNESLPPVIDFISPYENSSYAVGENINIKAYISNNEVLTNVIVKLFTEDMLPVCTIYSCAPASDNFNLNVVYSIDSTVQNGYYFLKIEACDEYNCQSAFRKIYISGIPEKLYCFVLLTKVNSSSLKVSTIDTSFNITQSFYVNSDYCSSAVSPQSHKLYIQGYITGDLNVYDMYSKAPDWNIASVPSPPFPYFTGLCVKEGLAYVCLRNSELKIYRDDGTWLSSFLTPSDTYPVKAFPFDDYIILELAPVSGTYNKLAVYLKPGYLLTQTYLLPFKITDIFKLDEDRLLIFGNNIYNKAIMREYSISGNSLQSLCNMPSEKLYDVEEISTGNYVLSFENEVDLYQYSNNSLITHINNISVKNICYEKLNNILVLSGASFVNLYTYPQFQDITNINITDSIYDVHIVY